MLEMYTKKQRVKEMPLEFGVDKLKPVLSGIEAAGGVDLYLPNPSIPNEILVGIAAAHGSVDVYECTCATVDEALAGGNGTCTNFSVQ